VIINLQENEESMDVESHSPARMSVKDRLGGHEGEGEEQEKIMMSGSSLIKTVYNPSVLARQKTEAAAEKVQVSRLLRLNARSFINVLNIGVFLF
jgi:hypothetical protein